MEKKKSRDDGEIKKEDRNKKEREEYVLSEPVQAGCFDWCSSACGNVRTLVSDGRRRLLSSSSSSPLSSLAGVCDEVQLLYSFQLSGDLTDLMSTTRTLDTECTGHENVVLFLVKMHFIQ